MKFTCPICETEGHISEQEPATPTVRTTCRQCGTILLINPRTGSIDAYKSPLRGTREYALTESHEPEPALPVSELRPATGSRDWPAVVTVMLVVLILISAGIYLILA
ncbi:MAG: hypothetical protein P8X90_09675 [Desulfobacterales bacterium]